MTMRGHAAANILPLVASNRIGREDQDGRFITFYGSSFIADHAGQLAVKAPRDAEAVLTATVDLDAIRDLRRSWGVFRDRRVDLFAPLLGYDGQ
jgi:N-carbamoylputrescine amidase